MIIIPDVHGRTFWHQAVSGHESEQIIFLGDYTDPYTYEGIEYWMGLRSLLEVIAFKRQHPQNVVLLLGNHDLSYLSSHLFRCRHDDENHEIIKQTLLDNLSLFDIVHEERIGQRRYLFSHAGILPDWLEEHSAVLGNIETGHEAIRLNQLFHQGILYPALGAVSVYRGGEHPAGSCVWADVEEFIDATPDLLAGCYQVFGHSQLQQPLITDRFACLDCRRAFRLDADHRFSELAES